MKKLEMKFDAKAEAAVIEIEGPIGELYGGVSAREFSDQLNQLGNAREIQLNIRSEGGSVFEGFTIYEKLRAHGAKIKGRIYGIAGSIASVIAMAADELEISESAWFMIHRAHTELRGNAGELEKTAELLARMDTNLITAYQKRTGLAEDKLREFLDGGKDSDGTWFTGAEAVEHGFADRVVDEAPIAAHVDLKVLGNCPDTVKAWAEAENAVADEVTKTRVRSAEVLNNLRKSLESGV